MNIKKSQMKSVLNILEEKSIRITPMRQLLLEYFMEKDKALGLSELENAFPRADRIIMYRTLKTFEEKGILHSIENSKEIKYGLCSDNCSPSIHLEEHPHFECTKCHQTTCLESAFIPQVEVPSGYSTQGYRMTIVGVCKNCEL